MTPSPEILDMLERLKFKKQWGKWYPDNGYIMWQADHIIPVVEGGGCCGLDNLQTLCIRCHKQDTKALAGRLAAKRRDKHQRSFDLDITT